jgi:DNA repair exonuclease SbcCD nuclease subunit
MSPAIKQIIERVESSPEEDQEELAEIARQIEARRTGVYRATADELRTLDEADRSGTASEEEVEAAFQSFRHR